MAGVVIPSKASTLLGFRDETELWALIAAVERAAFESYRRLALLMARQGNDELEKLFRDIAEEERRQEQEAANKMDPIASSRDIARLATELGIESVAKEEFEEAGGAQALTPHGALSLAIRNEERAFVLFSEVATDCTDLCLRKLCGRFANEERAHLVKLRLARQHLYRPADGPAPVVEPIPPAGIAEVSALRITRTGVALRELAAAVTSQDDNAIAAFLVTLADSIEGQAEIEIEPDGALVAGSMSSRQALLRALVNLEEDFGFFSHLLDAELEDADWRIVLGHAEATVERMALVRTRLSM
jgi:rubrerythrin